MSKIFISYRRDDSKDVVGRIYDHLKNKYGAESIFKDVESIPLGTDFRGVLDNSIKSCDVVLAVIGNKWLNLTNDSGERRIDDPDDFVSIEIEAALKRGIPVIPVLVRDAEMPNTKQLPSALKKLAFQNGLQVRADPDFNNDIKRLIGALNRILKQPIMDKLCQVFLLIWERIHKYLLVIWTEVPRKYLVSSVLILFVAIVYFSDNSQPPASEKFPPIKTSASEPDSVVLTPFPDGILKPLGTRENPIWLKPNTVYEGKTTIGPVYYKFRVPLDTKAKFKFSSKEIEKDYGEIGYATYMEDDASGNFYPVAKGGSENVDTNSFGLVENIFTPKNIREYYIYRINSWRDNLAYKLEYSLLDYKDAPYNFSEEEVSPVKHLHYAFKRSNKKSGNTLDKAVPILPMEIVAGITQDSCYYKLTLNRGVGATIYAYSKANNQSAEFGILNSDGSVAKRAKDFFFGGYEKIDWKRHIGKIKPVKETKEFILTIQNKRGEFPYELVYIEDK